MKKRFLKQMISLLLALAMLIGVVPAFGLSVSAKEVSGSINASSISEGDGLVLTGDTVLKMDTYLILDYIKGDHALTVQGSGKLTVNGSGNGIAVKSLHCTSDLFVQPGWHAIDVTETVYIDNANSFIVGGIYAEGNIEIQSNNATIAGNGNAIFSNGGNITLSGGTFDIGANGVAVYAKTGDIYMTGAFTVNSNNDRTIHAGMGELVINGSLKSTSGARFDPDVSFINRDKFSIGATGGFNFSGTTLEVTGLGGIRGGGVNLDADISITADSVSIITERYYALNGENIYVNSDNLWIENRGSEENENVSYTFHTIFANGDATIFSENGGIVGENCFFADGNLTLNGNFVLGADHDSGYAMRSIGRTEVNGNLRVITDDILCVYAEKGFSFNGSTLKLEGYHGIMVRNGDVNIVADSTEIVVSDDCAIQDATENDSVCNVYIDSDYLWLQGGKDEVHNSGCVDVRGTVTIYSDEATVMGNYGIDASGDIVLDGNFVVKGLLQEAIRSESRVGARGKLSLATEGEYPCLTTEAFVFDGSTLTADGYGGIDADGVVNITADSTTIITSVSSPIASTGDVYIDSDYLFLQNLMEEELHPLADWAGISAYGDVTVISDDATIIGKNGIRVAQWLQDTQGNVSLRGNFHVIGTINQAILCDNAVTVEGSLTAQGSVTEQGSDNPFNYGECYAIYANRFSFNGTTLNIECYGGIYAEGEVNITADSVVITTDVGDALHGCEVYVTANDLWAENKATKVNSNWQGRGYTQHGISAKSKLSLTVKGGTVIGYENGLNVYDKDNKYEHHYVYVDGSLTVVSKTGAGIYVPQGAANLFGRSIVSVGETHGVYADVLTFEGDSLRIDGDAGVYAISGVEMDGDDIRITAFNERRSGIWVENGYVDLKGKVVINTNGWYGINAASDVSFGEGYYAISGPKGNAQAVKAGGTLSVDGTLEIIQPDGGHINGNEIYGAGDSPALDLEMYSAIRDVSLLIDGPRDGKLPDRNASDVYFLDPRCTVESIVWYEDGEEMVSQDALFRAGHRYTVKITLSADDPYRFVHGVMGKVNGKSVTTGILGGDKKGMILTADLGECPLAIGSVDLGIRSPEEGKAPSTAVTSGSSAYGVYSRDVRWGVSTDGVNFTIMAAGEKFVGGKYYRVFMDVNLAGNHYKFPVTTADGTVQPDVVATVNGSPAVVEKAYDQDPEEVITVYFDFGKCNDFIIEEIAITGVTAPVVGQHPSYDVNMFGTGYHVDTTKNAYEDIYWKNPPEKWYYIKNGVSWWDVTDGGYDYVYENDVFLPGHQYQCKVYVATDDGYEFVNDVYAEVWPTATVNGNPATIKEYGSGLNWSQEVTYVFPCEENVVDRIVVDGITAPQKGQAPDYSPILGNTDLYTLDTDYGLNGSGIYWYDCEGRQLEAGEVFGDAGPYRMAIKFVPVYKDGAPLCTFSNEVDVLINGKYVTPYGNWDDVMVGSGTVWAFFTFRNASSAPELGVTVSGTVTSQGSPSDPVTLQLLYFNTTTVAYETQVSGNSASYVFEAVAAGVYTLRATKKDNVATEYTVVVNADSVVRNVTLLTDVLQGDVDGDSDVDLDDAIYLLYHVNFKDTYPVNQPVDFNGDSKEDLDDAIYLLYHVNFKETYPLH